MPKMTPDQYRAFLSDADLTQEGFARIIGANGRTGRRWVAEGPPPGPDLLARLLTERPELLEVVRRLADQRDRHEGMSQ